MHAELKNNEGWQKTCSGQAVAWSRLGGAAAKIPTPPEGGGSESVHEDRSSKKTGGNCCCISARHGSVNQQILKRTTLEEWCKRGSAGKPLQVLRLLLAPEGTKYQVSMQAP